MSLSFSAFPIELFQMTGPSGRPCPSGQCQPSGGASGRTLCSSGWGKLPTLSPSCFCLLACTETQLFSVLIGVGSHTRSSRLWPVEGEGSGFQRQICNDSEGEILLCIDVGVLAALLLDLGVA